jgi:hypothetical protein
MNFQIKTFSLDRGNHIIAITNGQVDIEGLKHVFARVIVETKPLLDCKVLVDLQDSTFKLLPFDLAEFLDRFDFDEWPHNNKVALVSSPAKDQFQQLTLLGEGLLKRGLKVVVFYDMKEAISWLSGIT